MRSIRLALALSVALYALPAHADILPPSSARIKVEKAEVTDFSCNRRPFAMEATKGTTRWFPYMGQQISQSGFHPHSIIGGVAGILILIPMTILAVPVDLAAAPFRKECKFKLTLSGSPVEWAGKSLPGVEIRAGGRTLLKKAIPQREAPVFYNTETSTVSDENGNFSLTLDGQTGKSNIFAILWSVKRHPGGTMRLTQHGKQFTLTELDPGFGVGIAEMAPMTLIPKPPVPIPAANP